MPEFYAAELGHDSAFDWAPMHGVFTVHRFMPTQSACNHHGSYSVHLLHVLGCGSRHNLRDVCGGWGNVIVSEPNKTMPSFVASPGQVFLTRVNALLMMLLQWFPMVRFVAMV